MFNLLQPYSILEQHKIYQNKGKRQGKTPFLCLLCEALSLTFHALVTHYIMFVFNLWTATPNQLYPVAMTLNDGVECARFWYHLIDLSRHEVASELACYWSRGFLSIIENTAGSYFVLRLKKEIDRQWKPFLEFVLWCIVNEILCTFNLLVLFRLWILNCHTQSNLYGRQDFEKRH